MKRSHAAMFAGILTAIVLTAVGFMTGRFTLDAAAADPPSAQIENQVVSETTLADDTVRVYAERDAALTTQIKQAETAMQTLDDSHGLQVEQMQAEIAQLSTRLEAKRAEISGQGQDLVELQQALKQDATVQQQKLTELQARDTTLRNQLNDTVGQLQAAYAEIAARQSALASSSSGSSGSSYEDDDDHEEHEEHDEHEEDDDDHGEHGGHDDDD
jgi:chromosome segregation ATPase